MIDTVLTWFALYGIPALFVALFAGQTGIIPVPTTIVLLTVGALLIDRTVAPLNVFLSCLSGAVLGDQFGYAVGRITGPRLSDRLQATRFGPMMVRAENYSHKWGAYSVFLSRWLVSPIGPYLNYIVGITKLNWVKFSSMSVAGETIWIGSCLFIGYFFSTSITQVDKLFVNLTWFFGALLATIFFWSRVRKALVKQSKEPSEN